VVAVLLTLVLAFFAVRDARSSQTEGSARSSLTLIAPAAAGGGWDLVAREGQQALRTGAIVNTVQVVNIPGAAGTIGLSQLVRLRGEESTVMVTGTVMLGGIGRRPDGNTLQQVTPIARLAEDFEVIAVAAGSKFRTLQDLVSAWKAAPASLPIGGGSAGGVDHLVAGQLARAAGIDVSTIHYTAHAGGGELTLSLLSTASGTVDVGISGFNDFRDLIEAGRLRVLAVVAPERLEGVDAPTMTELGYPGVDLVNWRGIVAPPDLSDAERTDLEEIVRQMVGTESWQAAVTRNRWVESLAYGDEFGTFLATEQQRIDGLLKELGLL